MNERYREAADVCADAGQLWRDDASIRVAGSDMHKESSAEAEKYELAALILSKLATGDWVLCEPIEGHDKLRYVPVELP